MAAATMLCLLPNSQWLVDLGQKQRQACSLLAHMEQGGARAV